MSDAKRFVDRLPANNSYTGGAARVYDAWMPPGTVFADDAVHQETLRRADGTGLELACGNGRFLAKMKNWKPKFDIKIKNLLRQPCISCKKARS